MATVLIYRNDGDRPFAEVALNSGDRVQLALDAGGVVIRCRRDAGAPAEILFAADAETMVIICAALHERTAAAPPPPLDRLLSIVMRLGAAADVRLAFQAAALAARRQR